jgi:hypothetical protein
VKKFISLLLRSVSSDTQRYEPHCNHQFRAECSLIKEAACGAAAVALDMGAVFFSDVSMRKSIAILGLAASSTTYAC